MPQSSPTPTPEPAEFSIEDAMLNTWVEDTGEYLRIDTDFPPAVPSEMPSADQS